MGYSDETDYLRVDAFLKGVVEARSLATGLETGLIDHLLTNGPSTAGEIEKRCAMDEKGASMLLGLLHSNNVTEEHGGTIMLTAAFVKALQYRDLLEAKLAFARLVLSDFTDLFTLLIAEPDQFFRSSRTFDLFAYGRAAEYSPENYELTKRWMRITTILTRYEARTCIGRYDFSPHRRMLDIGGNSGEFVLQICRRHPGLRASILDLPLVCDIGREHLAREQEAERIRFVEGNAFIDPLPGTFDLISFKSMLHDWPEKEALFLMEKAALSLEPGGTLLIFERVAMSAPARTPPYCAIPILLFFRYFRDPSFYERHLSDLGFRDILVTEIMLDAPFCLITARKRET
jgi:ubiquinone/menaquinone biosynthesis C-methylase UbiE